MQYYQELTILPDPEISSYFIWQKLYTQLHIALADISNNHGIDNIGVSFPDYYYDAKNQQSSKLGQRLRVFAQSEQDLQTLKINQWLERLSDYVHVKSIKPIPDNISGHWLVRRYRFKNLDKVAKEFAKHRGISMEEAVAHCRTYKQTPKAYPFINLKSETTGQPYKLSIWQEQVDEPQAGTFNTYGINNASGVTTVPHW